MKSNLFLLLLLFCGLLSAQNKTVTISGIVKDQAKMPVPFANVMLQSEAGVLLQGTLTPDDGRFAIAGITAGNYQLEFSFVGYHASKQKIFVGSLSEFLDVGTVEMAEESNQLAEVTVTAKSETIGSKMDKKTFSVADNIAQSGGSVLQTMQSLPGITVLDGKVQLRGNDRVTVLIDGKQTAMSGFGNQTGLDNISVGDREDRDHRQSLGQVRCQRQCGHRQQKKQAGRLERKGRTQFRIWRAVGTKIESADDQAAIPDDAQDQSVAVAQLPQK